jgi:CheY-like chemotaxis protein
MGNAVKFTERGEVVLKVQSAKCKVQSQSLSSPTLNLEPETLNQVVLHFSVQDTGIGIPEDRQDRLFQVFSQVDGSYTRKYGGTGLGLALSKQLVELMGGSIGVESKAGQGSIFWFTVPLESRIPQQSVETARATHSEASDSHPGDNPSLPAPESLPPTRSVRLLLVEDNLINQKLAVRILKKFGYEVEVADNGCEALTILSERSYGAILMDCQMPEMDGFEATREIRRREAQLPVPGSQSPDEQAPAASQPPTDNWQSGTAHVPIIALTANAVQGDKERCLAAGMDDYLTKPINPTELRKTLERWLSCGPTGKSGMNSL